MVNIMLQDARKERIKIVDFGLSNICSNNELLKTHCGSPEYAAPELFIDGKKYGPEVDLWSLGVVFYVMTSGRLPFMSPQDGHTPSDERRRKFMIQINRGLSAIQEKSISGMSNDYKNVVSRLLMPNAQKRITIQELSFHPWIIDRQKNCTQIHSGYNLDAVEHTEALDQVANAAHLDRSFVQATVSQKRFGDIGGMYNIAVHGMLRKNSASGLAEKALSNHSCPSIKNSLIEQAYKMMPNRPVDFNESMKHLFPLREVPSSNQFVSTTQTNFRHSVNPPKPVSGIIRRERNFGEYQKEYSRWIKKSAVSAPQANRIVRNQMPPLSTISRSETAPRADLITQRRSQRLASNRHELPTSKMFLRSGVKLLGREDFVPESVTDGNKTRVFYKPVQHRQNPQVVSKAVSMMKTSKKASNLFFHGE